MDESMTGTRMLELADGPPARRLGLVWSRERVQSATASAFVIAAETAFAGYAATAR
jgi:hypothetical protein